MKRNVRYLVLLLATLIICMVQGLLFVAKHTEAAHPSPLSLNYSSAIDKAHIALSKSLITPTSLQGDSETPNIGNSLVGKYALYVKNPQLIFPEPLPGNFTSHSSFSSSFQPNTPTGRDAVYNRNPSPLMLSTKSLSRFEENPRDLTPYLLKSLAKGVTISLALTYGSYYLQEQLRILAINEKASAVGELAAQTYVVASYAYTIYGFWGTGGVVPAIELSSKALMRTVMRRGMKTAVGYGVKYALKKGATFIVKEAITEFAPGVSSGGVTVVVGVSAALLQVAVKYGIHLYEEQKEHERIDLMLQILRKEEQTENTLQAIVEQRFGTFSYK